MIWFYRFLFIPVLLAMAPGYLRRMKRRGGYRENFGQRFGGNVRLPKKLAGARRVWLQAVSVGEMLAIAPILEELAGEQAGKLKIAKVDVDDNQGLARQYGVQSIPTMIVFKDGQEAARIVGAKGKGQLLVYETSGPDKKYAAALKSIDNLGKVVDVLHKRAEKLK